MAEGRQRPVRSPASDRHRAKRGKNLAVLAALLAFVVLVYLVSIVRMSG